MTREGRALTVLVTGGDAATREAGIAGLIDEADPGAVITVILEGLSTGTDAFERFSGRPQLQVVRLAPGCLCCTGNLPLRVYLNRLLRQRPDRLFLSLADSRHLAAIHQFLAQPVYADWLTLDVTMSYDAVG